MINHLLAALRGDPNNAALRTLVLDTIAAQGDANALEDVIELCGDEAVDSHTRRAELRALRHASDDATPDLIRQAREALDAGDKARARCLYEDALSRNPALEDPHVTAALSGKVVSIMDARRQTSIANDDTSSDDVVHLTQPPVSLVTFADVGGLDEIKAQIRRRIITPFVKPSLFARFKRSAGGGILMYGPPGCGKTLLARATAGECGARFYNVAISDILDMYIGESERKLHELFEVARRTAPAVIFFDEVEALGGKREHTREATSAKLASQFLTELDGFAQRNDNVLVLGATNVPWAVDAAFRRPGRFDRVIFIPPPDRDAREAILGLLLRGRPCDASVRADAIARRTSGYSGADLRFLIESAIDEAIDASISEGREVPLTTDHIDTALAQTKPTTGEWLTTARNHARYANQSGQYDDVLTFLDRNGTR